MKQQSIIFGIAGLVIGALLTFVLTSTSASKTSMTAQPTAMEHGSANTTMSMSGDDMMASLEGKTGEEFDKAFISAMIEHHSSAIDMAKAAQISAGRQEIKDLSNDIIEAQQKEIDMMKQWQMDWSMAQ